MSAMVVCACRRIHPHVFSVNQNECAHSVRLRLIRLHLCSLSAVNIGSLNCWAVGEITERSETGWPWAHLILFFTDDLANVSGIMHCLRAMEAELSQRLPLLYGTVKVKKYPIKSQRLLGRVNKWNCTRELWKRYLPTHHILVCSQRKSTHPLSGVIMAYL